MPGRLRTQLAAVDALLPKVEALLSEVSDVAPKGVFSIENVVMHGRGLLDDPKAAAWNDAQSGLTTCEIAMRDLSEMLTSRIERSERRKKRRCGAQGDINDDPNRLTDQTEAIRSEQ